MWPLFNGRQSSTRWRRRRLHERAPPLIKRYPRCFAPAGAARCRHGAPQLCARRGGVLGSSPGAGCAAFGRKLLLLPPGVALHVEHSGCGRGWRAQRRAAVPGAGAAGRRIAAGGRLRFRMPVVNTWALNCAESASAMSLAAALTNQGGRLPPTNLTRRTSAATSAGVKGARCQACQLSACLLACLRLPLLRWTAGCRCRCFISTITLRRRPLREPGRGVWEMLQQLLQEVPKPLATRVISAVTHFADVRD